MAILRAFFADKTPRYPQRQSEVRLRPADTSPEKDNAKSRAASTPSEAEQRK